MIDINMAIEVMVYKFFDDKSIGTFTYTRAPINFKNQQLTEKLSQLIIRKVKKCKAYSSFKEIFEVQI